MIREADLGEAALDRTENIVARGAAGVATTERVNVVVGEMSHGGIIVPSNFMLISSTALTVRSMSKDAAERLVPERSVPVSGFSRELREAGDIQRFRFDFPLRGEAVWPVHIVFSASLRVAQVKTGDLKAVTIADVSSAEEARERWIERWRAGMRKTRFNAPRRAGRSPDRPLARH